MPSEGRSVAVTLPVGAPPVLRSERAKVTCSPGSGAPLAGVNDSAVSARLTSSIFAPAGRVSSVGPGVTMP